jgi:hypothetical protein
MRFTNLAQSSGPAPIFRHRAVTSADRPRNLALFATEIPERAHSISHSFSDIGDQARTVALLERELPFNLVMNGVR